MNIQDTDFLVDEDGKKSLSVCAYINKERRTLKVLTIDFEKQVVICEDGVEKRLFTFDNIYLCHCDRRKECGKKH